MAVDLATVAFFVLHSVDFKSAALLFPVGLTAGRLTLSTADNPRDEKMLGFAFLVHGNHPFLFAFRSLLAASERLFSPLKDLLSLHL